jgi:hypothetical protein
VLEQAAAVLLVVGLLGLAANQATRIILQGSLFGWLRDCVAWRRLPLPGWVCMFLQKLFDCHLCMGQEVAAGLTWTTIGAGLLTDAGVLPPLAWTVLAVIGPLAVGGVDQLIELVRRFQRES